MKRDKHLRRLNDHSLSREREYAWRQCINAANRLQKAASDMINREQHLPIWLLQREYADHLAWLEIICFEIEFRKIP